MELKKSISFLFTSCLFAINIVSIGAVGHFLSIIPGSIWNYPRKIFYIELIIYFSFDLLLMILIFFIFIIYCTPKLKYAKIVIFFIIIDLIIRSIFIIVILLEKTGRIFWENIIQNPSGYSTQDISTAKSWIIAKNIEISTLFISNIFGILSLIYFYKFIKKEEESEKESLIEIERN